MCKGGGPMATEVQTVTVELGLAPLRPRPLVPAIVRPPRQRRGIGLAASLTIALDRRRFFVLLPFAIIAGLTAYVYAGATPEPLMLGGVAAASASFVALSWRTHTLLRFATLCGAFWFGFCLLAIHGALFGTVMLSGSRYGVYQVHVDEIVSAVDGDLRVIVSAIAPGPGEDAVPMRRARIVVSGRPNLAPGDVIEGTMRFYPVPGPAVPGGFDSQFHGYFDGVGAYGTSFGTPAIVSVGDASAPDRLIDTVRRTIGSRIDATLQEPAAGIARALITGDQTEVTAEARDVMAAAGLAHVLSVSGLHLTLVAGGVFVALRMALSLSLGLSRRLSVKRLSAFGGIVVALLYFSISGGNVAALRSTLMILLVFGAVIFGRRALTMRNVGIAAIIVIIVDPASVFRPSFQLSFAAVAALVGAWEAGHGEREKGRGLGRQFAGYLLGSAATSLVAGAATLLFSIYHFQQTSPLGVLGNLATIPLVGFLMMPAAVLAAIAMPFGFEAPFLRVVGWSIDRMLDVAQAVASWSTGLDASPLLAPASLGIGFAALGWFAFFGDRWRYLGPVLAIPAVLLFAQDRPPDVLIADTTQALAISGPDGLELMAGRAGSFAVEVWGETFGTSISEGGLARCDSIGCIARSPAGFTVALELDPAAFAEDCGVADLIVARRRVPAWCVGSGTIIDAAALASGGVHWLRWNAADQTFEVRPAITGLNRAWRAALP
ncbi:MAG: hypothetical protein JWR75_348 [Devosia sp.]|nr:hypothetical protein [Devosia sp.]